MQGAPPVGVWGPLMLPGGVERGTLRLRAEGGSLRNLRVFALRRPAEAVSRRGRAAPVLNGAFKEPGWPRQPQVEGFLAGADRFAAMPTQAWLYHTADALYVGVYARETRGDTLVAGEEWVELRLERPGGGVLRARVSAAGRLEAPEGAAAGVEVATARYEGGWAAEWAVPFAAMGGPPETGETWGFDVTRHRANVRTERSRWGGAPGEEDAAAGGELRFAPAP
jgi:hypothetical protein